jgi:FKBP-type peptidyl-prolyl cis-trans isomerase
MANMNRKLGIALVAVAGLCLGQLFFGARADDKKEKVIKTKSGLEYVDQKVGTGKVAKSGDKVTVHYTGWLKSNKKKFDSSKDRNRPFTFDLGQGDVIKGWDEGVQGMKVGGKRKLIIPPKLAYGDKDIKDQNGNVIIPKGSTLVFEVELLKVESD